MAASLLRTLRGAARLGLALVALASPGCALLTRPAEGPRREPVRDHRLLDREVPRLRVEVDRVQGVEPRPEALEKFRRRLAFYADKPGGIEVVVDGVIPRERWDGSRRGLAGLVREHFRGAADRGTADLYVVYAPKWEGYRGYCWRAGDLAEDLDFPVLVVLADRLRPILWLTGTTQEYAVLVHEAGHALGLVTEASHGRRGHCTHGWCGMYAGVDARSGIAWLLPTLLAGQLPSHYCRDCRDDLWPGGTAPGLREVPGLPTERSPGCDPDFAGDKEDEPVSGGGG